jgi:hypothetical protein
MSVIKNEKIFVEVGRTCLGDFLATDKIDSIVWMAQFSKSLSDIITDGREIGGRVQPVFHLQTLLACAIQAIKNHGYISKAKACELETSSTAGDTLYLYNGDTWNKVAPYQPTEDEMTEAQLVIDYVKTITTENDYKFNLQNIATLEHISYKGIGYAVSMIPFYRKAMELIQPKSTKASEHVGTVGNREALSLIFKSVYVFENFYGSTYIYRFVDADNNVIIWKSTNNFDFTVGETVECVAMIKSHDEYKGTKQTYINRPKFKEVK